MTYLKLKNKNYEFNKNKKPDYLYIKYIKENKRHRIASNFINMTERSGAYDDCDVLLLIWH